MVRTRIERPPALNPGILRSSDMRISPLKEIKSGPSDCMLVLALLTHTRHDANFDVPHGRTSPFQCK